MPLASPAKTMSTSRWLSRGPPFPPVAVDDPAPMAFVVSILVDYNYLHERFDTDLATTDRYASSRGRDRKPDCRGVEGAPAVFQATSRAGSGHRAGAARHRPAGCSRVPHSTPGL